MSQHLLPIYMRDVSLWILVALAHLCLLWSWPYKKTFKNANSSRQALRVEQIALQEPTPLAYSAKPEASATKMAQVNKPPLPAPSKSFEGKTPPKPSPSKPTSATKTTQKATSTNKPPVKAPVGKNTSRPKPPVKTNEANPSARTSAPAASDSQKKNSNAEKPNGNAKKANSSAKKTSGNAQKANGNAQQAKGSTQNEGVSKRARAALATIANIGQITSEQKTGAPKTSISRAERAAHQEAYSSQLISFLQQELQLPEYGAVCVHLQLSSDGSYLAHQVLSSDSRANSAHLEAKLPKLLFPKTLLTGDKVRSFTLNFNNRV